MRIGKFIGALFIAAVFCGAYAAALPNALAAVAVQEETIQEEHISAKYPQFSGIESDYARNKINMDVKVAVGEFVDSCKKNQYNRECLVEYKVYYNEEGKLSFTLLMYEYNGGAHGTTTLKGYTYDVQTGERCALTQLCDYRPSELNQRIFEHAKANDVFLFSDFRGLKQYPSNFYLNEDGKPVILFQQYEIAPYSSGIIKIAL